jgi:iron complex transport system ATP-binding protein
VTLASTNLDCGYRRAILRGVSLTVRGGELFVILGPNGSGKTTLLRTLARLVRPLKGTVTLNGKDVWSCAPSHVAQAVAFTSQVLAPDWPFTVREFITLGRAPHRGWWRPLRAHDHRVIDAALEQFGLRAAADRPVTELSGGEWQRVKLARALTQEARVLLLDEPITHLDPRFQLDLLCLLRTLVRERHLAVVMTLHDLNLVAAWADRVALLADNRVHAEGTPETVLTGPSLSAAYNIPLVVAPHPMSGAPVVSLVPVAAPPGEERKWV